MSPGASSVAPDREGELDYEAALAWPAISAEHVDEAARIMMADTHMQLEAAEGLEETFARWVGSRYALSAANGTSALFAAFHAVGLEPGSEVLVPTLTFWASVLPLCWLGLVPVFCDVDEETLCISADEIERKMTSRTRAVLVVHLFGQVADMDRIAALAGAHGLTLIEDAAHALGAFHRDRRLGTIGHIGCFSFQSSKYLPTGEGGMLVTDDRELYDRASCLVDYRRVGLLDNPSLAPLQNTGLGLKFRIHPAAAVLASSQLPALDERLTRIARETEVVGAAAVEHPGLRLPAPSPGGRRSYWTRLHLRYEDGWLGGRSARSIREALNAAGVLIFDEVTPYDRGLHAEPIFRLPELMPVHWFGNDPSLRERVLRGPGSMPVSEGLERANWLTFPVFPNPDPAFRSRYVDLLHDALADLQEEAR